MNNMICHLSVLHLRLSHILHELVGVRSLMQLADAPQALMDFGEGAVDQLTKSRTKLSESGIKALRCDLTLVLHRALIYQDLRIG